MRLWLTRLALATLVPLGLLASLELALRAAGYGYPSAFFVKISGSEAVAANQEFGRRFFPRALVRTPVPARLEQRKPQGTFRIFVLGGSAAMGEPEPAFSFGRILQALLEDLHPGIRFEVVNAAMTAINSHVALAIARDCARQSPDLFIVYMGNNEVVGPYGPGTVFQGFVPILPLIRAGIWLNGTKTGQLLTAGLSRLAPQERFAEWGGMAMFLDRQVPVDDPRLEAVYQDFQANVTDICATARSAGAQVILSTVATNLRDCAPFASVHKAGLAPQDRARWEDAYRQGAVAREAGDHTAAVKRLLEAARIDDHHADLHFQLGKSYAALGNPGEARRHLTAARDLDALRFRADTRIIQIVRETAAGRAHLVELEEAFEQASGGPIGDGLLYEHVHLNPDGNYLAAETLLGAIEPLLPAWIAERRRPGPAGRSQVAARLALTRWDLCRMEANMLAMMSRPPFTNQSDYTARRPERDRRLQELARCYSAPETVAEARSAYTAAVERNPEDLALRSRFAELLTEAGEHAVAARQFQTMLDRVPGVKAWQAALAGVLRDMGRNQEALAQLEEILRRDRHYAPALAGIGTVLQREKKWDQAIEQYRAALAVNPDFPDAHNNLGLTLAAAGRLEEAARHYERALEVNPSYPEAHNNFGLCLLRLGRTEVAIHHFTQAVRLKPTLAGASYNLAAALAFRGRFAEAVPHFEEALRADPKLAEAHYGLGAVLAAQGRIERAMKNFSAALTIRPNMAEAHYNLGLLHARQGTLREAERHYAAALKIKPNYPEALNNLGTALARQGRLEEAIAAFNRALAIRPDFADARRNLETAQAASRNR
jgi:tetratricopeptide (TPR) repeat protein